MKTLPLYLLLTLCCCQQSFARSSNLLQAIKQKIVKANIGGNTYGNSNYPSYYGKCVNMTLENLTDSNQTLTIENGYHLKNSTKAHQDLITIDKVTITLGPKKRRSIALNALCCEKTNKSPDNYDSFEISFKHSGSILALINQLNKYGIYKNMAAQAMWCLTNGNPVDNLYDTHKDTAIENKLVQWMCEELDQVVPKRKTLPQFKVNQSTGASTRILKHPLELHGKVNLHFSEPAQVSFYITDLNNLIVDTVLYQDHLVASGNNTFQWSYRGQLLEGKYLFQMKKNNEWFILGEIKLTEEKMNLIPKYQ